MFYLIIIAITLACFILGFIIISLLRLLFRHEKSMALSKEEQSAALSVPQPVVTPSTQPMVQVIVQSGKPSVIEPLVQPDENPVITPMQVLQPDEKPVRTALPFPPEKKREKPEKEENLFFTLSRSDVFDHILEMCNDRERYPIKPEVSEKNNEKMPDFLSIGGWCFGMMFARNEIVFNFVLRMNEQTAKLLGARYFVQKASSLSEENWYSLTIDRSFINKSEVYVIIEECCEFTLKESLAKKKKDDALASMEEMNAERERLENKLAENLIQMEKATAAAEAEYHAKLEKYKAEHYTKLYITRKEIADYTRGLNNPDIIVVERPDQPQLPMSLKHKEKTYAMLHATDTGVLMIVRISGDYAALLAGRHPELCRTKFPKGANWYQLPADGAFADKKAIYKVLAESCDFVQTKPITAKPAAVKTAATKHTADEAVKKRVKR